MSPFLRQTQPSRSFLFLTRSQHLIFVYHQFASFCSFLSRNRIGKEIRKQLAKLSNGPGVGAYDINQTVKIIKIQ